MVIQNKYTVNNPASMQEWGYYKNTEILAELLLNKKLFFRAGSTIYGCNPVIFFSIGREK